MHDDRAVVEARIARILAQRIRPQIYGPVAPLEVTWWPAPGEPVTVSEALGQAYEPAALGQLWGPPWATAWFRFRGRVPDNWAGEDVEALIDLGFAVDRPGFSMEGLAFRPDGTPVKGLAPCSTWVPVSRAGEDRPGTVVTGADGQVDFYVEAAANPDVHAGELFLPTGLGRRETAGDSPLGVLRRAELALRRPAVAELAADVEVLLQLMAELALHDPRRHEILRALERMADRLDLDDVAQTTASARAELTAVLARPAAGSAHRLSAVGNAHIDTAWLWPVRETVRKVSRTVANVTSLLESGERFVFAFSQAQQLAWLEEHQPALFERLAAWVRTGQIVPVGGLWVEPDGNVPGGEAMARQLVYGKRFFLDRFGVETQEVWLPDSFGYSGALPQLVRAAGNRWMLTQKLSWNQTNHFPHHSFWWEGIDGSRVFTHFPPVDTYNATVSGAELAHVVENYAEHGRATRSLLPFGYGDGGGGPTREMLARIRRLGDLEGAPRVVHEAPVDFFRAAEEEYGAAAPTWTGELYLESHRGVLTSRADIKRDNRRCEALLHEAELWAATATLRRGAKYPHAALERMWKDVLLLQFHDILPGTSIGWVYEDASRTHAAVAAEAEAIIAASFAALAGEDDPAATAPTAAAPDHAATGRAQQYCANASPQANEGVAPLGIGVRQTSPSPVEVVRQGSGWRLENGLLEVVVDEAGLIRQILDLNSGRDAVAPGQAANLLQLHPDFPTKYDAWDLDSYYRNVRVDLVDAVAVEAIDGGVTVERKFGASRARQTITLLPGEPYVRLVTDVDWHEGEHILKLAFPLDVHTDRVASEVQFGHVQRPTTVNTSWDAARFECANHRWVFAGESGFGVALANDRTYGHDVSRVPRPGGGTTCSIRVSLLRAPRFPDPQSDLGPHQFVHLLQPGAAIGDAVRLGYLANLPLRPAPAVTTPVEPIVTMDHPAVMIETVKVADDGSGDLILRLYEAHGGRAEATLRSSFALARAQDCDLLERPRPDLSLEAGTDWVALDLRPFEVKTVRLTPAT
jgi:alpha-mannosidase